MKTVPAIALTPAAQQWLAETTAARPLNVFERACNLINQRDNILAIVSSDRGMTPFAIVVASDDRAPFSGVSVTHSVQLEPDHLIVGPLDVTLSGARLWNPTPDWPGVRRSFETDAAALRGLATMAIEMRTPGSLLDLYGEAPFRRALDVALLERSRRGASQLVRGLTLCDGEAGLSGVRLLAGLGGGLTPAGDDFIVGALLAAWAGLYGPTAVALISALAEAAADRTTLLSAAYLRAAARGECPAYWHALFEAARAADWPKARTAVRSLMSIGHTSGADALAGFLAVHFHSQEPQPCER